MSVLEYEPTEENSLAIANKYLRNSPEELLDPDNHSNLEYKKLATDTSDIYFRLEQNAWFKWAAARVADQMALENAEKERIQAQKDAQAKALAKALKAYKEKVSEKNSYGCLAFVLLIIAGVIFIADLGAAMCPGTIGLICFCVWAYRRDHLPPPPSVWIKAQNSSAYSKKLNADKNLRLIAEKDVEKKLPSVFKPFWPFTIHLAKPAL